ncbi:MAG: dolichyl-phosphate-mannose-protein mannosyltransferase, partial [Actinomycetota bacterium]|nr:dolichyl-phosphate-mannose-protein mannosyltransferase [Actinomycetota bacterium]
MSAITIFAGVLRGVRLLVPDGYIGDEAAYSKDACWYAFHSKAICHAGAELNLEHPPLAKFIMSIAMHIWGFSTFTTRIFSVVFGTLTIALFYLLARKLLGSTLGASIASGALAIDFMHFVHSRVAMLDVFLVFFAVLALLFLVQDRDRLFGAGMSGGWRPWRIAAGAAAGAAMATKWTGLLVLVSVAFLSFTWEVKLRREKRPHPLISAAVEQGPWLVLSYALVPVFVYALTFLGR